MKNDFGKTEASVKKLNDFPFYYACFHGDYNLNGLIESTSDSPAALVSFFEKYYSGFGRPVSLESLSRPDIAGGCSAFFCRSNDGLPLVGKNIDWKRAPLLLLKTVPSGGYDSLSIVNLEFCDIFRLGSFDHSLLTAPFIPLDGMNSEGLIVTTLSVHEAVEYPKHPGHKSAGDFNIVRILLDNCRNVQEALDLIGKYNIIQTGPIPVHYLIADKTESCAVEFPEGRIHIDRNRDENYLTNFNKLDKNHYEKNRNNCDRYRKLEKVFREKRGILEQGEAAALLDAVSLFQPNYALPSTICSLVYSPETLTMRIKIGKEAGSYSVSLQSVNHE